MTEQNHPAEPLAVRPAATVMLVRDTDVDCLEVFLMPVIMDAGRMGRTLTRIAHEIVERNRGTELLALVGMMLVVLLFVISSGALQAAP